MLKRLMLKILRSGRASRLLKSLYAEFKKEQVLMSIDIPEVSPINIKPSDVKKPRINLFVPGISPKAMFGGVSTALDIFLDLSNKFSDVRIIVTDETQCPLNPKLNQFSPAQLEAESEGKVVVWAGDRYGKSIFIRENDLFVSTAWWTAYLGFNIIESQISFFGGSKKKLVYVIQDYEPNFYPWSSRYALATSTYSRSKDTIAIINSKLLADYLSSKGHSFFASCYFEPKLNINLIEKCINASIEKKKKLVFVYGRPSVQRNAFELTIQSLRAWASSGKAHAAGWEVISAGEEHDDIDLGGGLTLKSVGKLSISEYADLLSQTAVGLSLMISPHPSYPPLELAAFGAGVVTNTFESKNLSDFHPSIFSVNDLSPGKIAEAVAWKCHEFEVDTEINWRRRKNFSWQYIENSTDSHFGEQICQYIDSFLDERQK